MKKGCLYSFIALLILSFGCNKALIKSKREIDTITDSLNTSWDAMIISDDQKIEDIKTLVEEISKAKIPDNGELRELQKLSKKIRSRRFNEHTMEDSGKIDAYDMATDSLIMHTFTLLKNNPGIDTLPKTLHLKDQVMDADNNVIIYRIHYDNWARQFNEYLDEHQGKLRKMKKPYSGYTKRALFELKTGVRN
ncbi:MAG TPA: hypothetical protein VNW99_00960 [Cytophagaceae bacterium]|nr:hypothetical protein [Cytophagaceae bacterium]